MKIIVNGAGGRMGKALTTLIEKSSEREIAALVSAEFETESEKNIFKSIDEFSGEADCIIDFSNHTACLLLCEYAVRRSIPLIIATTGITKEEKEIINKASEKIPVFLSANMSLGVALVSCIAKIAAKAFPDSDIEIVESHHSQKLDVPSGTALLLADSIKSVRTESEYVIGRHTDGKRAKNEIGIHSLRMGNGAGTHEIIFAMDSQVVTVKHEAQSISLFAEGALAAADFLIGKEPGLYGMEDILE